MGLLREIQDEVIDADRLLASVLRKARVLAAELDNEPLRQWASHELNGYPDEAALPPYRAMRPVPVRGTFAGPGGSRAENMPIPQLSVDERLRDGWLFNFAFTEPVAVYEEALRADQGDLKAPWPAEALVVARPRVLEWMECMTAWRVLTRGQIIGVVEGVRNRLLEFVLELKREAPEAGDVPASELPLSKDRVTQIVSMTIYAGSVTDQSVNVQGVAGNIAGGHGNRSRQGDVPTA
jgi:AbiTii